MWFQSRNWLLSYEISRKGNYLLTGHKQTTETQLQLPTIKLSLDKSLCQPAPGKNLVSDPKSGSDVTDSGADATGAATGAWGGGADGGNASAMKVVTQCP